MKKIKIAFFDIDGTLIDMNTKRISEKMLETLVRLKENGIILCLATGRSPMALPHFKKVEFDAFLTFNGSLSLVSVLAVLSLTPRYLARSFFVMSSSACNLRKAFFISGVSSGIFILLLLFLLLIVDYFHYKM